MASLQQEAWAPSGAAHTSPEHYQLDNQVKFQTSLAWDTLDLIEEKETTSQRSYTNQLIPNGGSCLVKAMVFPVVMYGCESWAVKKAERRRIDAFELWCWRRLLRVPWTARGSNPIHSEGDQPWDFFGRNDGKAETPVLWPPHVKS